jgi:hypothetical protein
VISADAHPSNVVGEVIDAVGHGTREVGIDEVVDVDLLWCALLPPLATIIGIVSNELFLLGVNGNKRFPCLQKGCGLGVDVPRLCITIDV